MWQFSEDYEEIDLDRSTWFVLRHAEWTIQSRTSSITGWSEEDGKLEAKRYGGWSLELLIKVWSPMNQEPHSEYGFSLCSPQGNIQLVYPWAKNADLGDYTLKLCIISTRTSATLLIMVQLLQLAQPPGQTRIMGICGKNCFLVQRWRLSSILRLEHHLRWWTWRAKLHELDRLTLSHLSPVSLGSYRSVSSAVRLQSLTRCLRQ